MPRTASRLVVVAASLALAALLPPAPAAWARGGSGGGGGGNGGGGALATTGAIVPDELLVALTDPESDADAAALVALVGGVGTERVGETEYRLVRLAPGSSLTAAFDLLERDPRADRVALHHVGDAPEGDPATSTVLGGDILLAVAAQPALAGLDLPGAHALATGSGVTVAVLDSGVDAAHPLLAGRLAPGRDFVDGDSDPTDERTHADTDGDGLVDEQFGHGTFVASLVLTVAPDARVLPVRVLDANGRGTAARVAAGIQWAVDHGAHVVNLSLEISTDAALVRAAVEYAGARDVVVVAGAGNTGSGSVAFPADLGEALSVGATDADGVLAGFSSYGKRLGLVAPGVDLVGAYPLSATPAGTARWSGTSFAAPLVAGTVALVRSRYPALSAGAAEDRVTRSAASVVAVNDPLLRDQFGAGLVRPAAALR